MHVDAARLNQLSELVIGMCVDVNRQTGPGLLDAVYEEFLCVLLAEAGMPCMRQGESRLIHLEAAPSFPHSGPSGALCQHPS